MFKISIIIPVYNTEQYLKKCIESILNQTIDGIEVIIVNDGSTDNSLDIINKYQKKYNNIVVINQPNSGQGSARNAALDIARGEYIGFVDSDDWVNPEMYEKLYKRAKDDGSDIVVCDFVNVYSNCERIIKVNSFEPTNVCDNIKIIFDDIKGPCNKIYKAGLFKTNRFPGKIRFEDFALLPILFYESKRVSKLDEPLYYYLQRDNSTMGKTRKIDMQIFDILKALDILYDYFMKYNEIFLTEALYAKYTKIYINYIIRGKIRLRKKVGYIINMIKPVNKRFPNWRKNKMYRDDFKTRGFVYNFILSCFDLWLSNLKIIWR
ncbi:MAG: glycosyltransferase [Bacilli bacterium]|nr:glycosyltransferase [Bacilli bacterium]